MSYTFNPFTGNLDVTPFSLDGAGKIPSNYLPSYVDDVVEYDDLAGFPGTGETGKIYVAKDTGYTYRWTGSVYVRIGSGGEVGLNLGSEGSPSLFFNGDANTGLYSPGAGQVGISTNGTGRLFVDAAGRVGIGSVSAGDLFEVSKASDSSVGPVLSLRNSTDLGGTNSGAEIRFNFRDTASDRYCVIGAANGSSSSRSGHIYFKTNSGTDAPVERLRITAGGKVGIGTTSPLNPLHVVGSSRFNVSGSNNLLITAEGGAPYIQVEQNASLHFGTNSQLRATIDSSGNVGIGTSSPSEVLDVNGTIRTYQSTNAATFKNNQLRADSSGAFYFDHGTVGQQFNFRVSNASALDKTALTISSSGNVGIGTTSPASTLDLNGSFTHRNSSGNVSLSTIPTGIGGGTTYSLGATDGSGNLLTGLSLESGIPVPGVRGGIVRTTSSSAPVLSFKTANSSSALISFDVNGTERVRIDSSGRLGVGTSSPSATLEVVGSARFFGGSGTDGQLTIGSTGASNDAVIIKYDNANDRLQFYNWGASTSNQNTFVIDNANSRVGIGTTNPLGDLTISNGGAHGIEIQPNISTNVNRITNYNRSNNTYVSFKLDALDHQFNISGVEAARIDTSGRLLVGTSSIASGGYAVAESARFLVQGRVGSGTDSGRINLQRGSVPTIANQGIGGIYFTDSSNNGYASIESSCDGNTGTGDYPARLTFSTTADGESSPTERVRINAAGGFKWSDNGTYTSPTDAKVEFRQSTNVEGLSVRSTNASFTSAVLLVRSDRNASGGEYNFISAGVAGVDTRFIVSNDGDVTNINNSYGGISDIKLKENIVDATSQWDDIKALRPVNYNFKEGQTHTQLGLIAQEVELVSPGLVSESPDRDEEGTDLGTVTKSVNYSVLYMKAVKALQEAMERIETLEAKVAALEAS